MKSIYIRLFVLLGIATAQSVAFVNCGQNFQVKSETFDLSSQSPVTFESLSALNISEPAPQFSSQDRIVLKGICTSGIEVEITGDLLAPMKTLCSQQKFEIEVYLSLIVPC